MSYSEENGQVVLTMSREEFQDLMLRFSRTIGIPAHAYWKEEIRRIMDRLNSGNPHYRPYRTGETKC